MHMTTVAGARTHRRLCSWNALVPLAIELAAFGDGWTIDAAYTPWSAPADAIVSERVSNRP
jgi:hypothetical protein